MTLGISAQVSLDFFVRYWRRVNTSTLRRWNLKTVVLLWKRIQCFPSTLRRRNLKTQQSSVILDLCLRKTRSGKSRDYIVLEKLRSQNVFRSHEVEKRVFSNSRGLKSVFGKLRFVTWAVGQTVEIMLRFHGRFPRPGVDAAEESR